MEIVETRSQKNVVNAPQIYRGKREQQALQIKFYHSTALGIIGTSSRISKNGINDLPANTVPFGWPSPRRRH
jgi:hypothetical protein